MKILRILKEKEGWIAVQKPSGMHVHPPEDQSHRISDNQNCLKLLRKQLGKLVYPVHRLDRATSGVLVFALSPEMASALGKQFQERSVKKTYIAVVRGHVADNFEINRPLKDSGPAQTHVTRITPVEFPWPNERFPSSRYSLIWAQPLTGRMHQIRRHLSGLGHPLVGDTRYGDGEHNRIFRDQFGIQQLWLHAHSISFQDPETQALIHIQARFPPQWHPLFDVFGICPWETIAT